MRREIIAGVLIGVLFGSAVLAPGGALLSSTAAQTSKKRPRQAVRLPAKPVAGRPLSHYQSIGERDMFRPTVSAHNPPPAPVKLPIFEGATEPVAPVWTSPAEGWTYAGYAQIDGVAQAILQEPSTGQAVFLHQGENFRGGTVEEITVDNLRIAFGEHTEVMPKSDEYTTSPTVSSPAGPQPMLEPPQPFPGGRGGTTFIPRASSRPAYGVPGRGAVVPPVAPVMRPPAAPPATDMQQRVSRLREEWAARRRRMMDQLRRVPASPGAAPAAQPLPQAAPPTAPEAEPPQQ